MRSRLLWLSAALSLWVVVGAVGPGASKSEKLVDKMHDHYVERFNDLEATKRGVFGASRVESDNINSHHKPGGDPGYDPEGFQTTVAIFGAHGKPLTTSNLSLRFSRHPGPVKNDERLPAPPARKDNRSELDKGKGVVKKWAKDGGKPVTAKEGETLWEARPIRLTKKECVSCHAGMKLNDPVAVIVYRVTPKIKK